MKIQKKTGLKRIIYAGGYSYKGLIHNFFHEAAFRQEVILTAILLPIAFLIEATTIERILLVASLALVLIVELLNTAIEATVDRISLDFNSLSGLAKDTGSAAVFVSLLFCGFTWITILFFN